MSNEVVTMYDMFRLINQSAGLSGKSYVLSKELAHVGVKVLAWVSELTKEEPLLSEFNIHMLNRNNEFDCSKAERELGFRCRPFSESIRDTVAWLRLEGFVKETDEPQVRDINCSTLLSTFFTEDRLNSLLNYVSSTVGKRRSADASET